LAAVSGSGSSEVVSGLCCIGALIPPSFSTAIFGKEEVAVSSLSAKKIKKK
jgi:hypothetical protein